ncbi:MAG: DEAD/DEAH box helicase [Alphaproteobacteria bacterium]|jgi:SNF2 family DNA or RNA helicase|nr:DEAD/DEAH box helicase [Alphaproteobacteria bacterium]
MLKYSDLTRKQDSAIDHIFSNNASILVAPTGAGKTVICLTAVAELIKAGVIKRAIVACPAKVVSVWAKEAAKWQHTKHLNVVALTGDPVQRVATAKGGADIFVVSLNNLDSLLSVNHGADGIIVDELSKAAGKQTKGLKTKSKGGCFVWRVGMTATPVAQNFEKLYGMCRILDGGVALGTNKDKYLQQYFNVDYSGYNYTLRHNAGQAILNKIDHLVHMVEDTKEQDLPPIRHIEQRFDMPDDSRDIYETMKKEMVVKGIPAVNEAVKSGKLRQIASGFIYHERGGMTGADVTETLDGDRVRHAQIWVDNLLGARGVIFYEFVAHLDVLKYTMSPMIFTTDIEEFKAGGKQILLAQINSVSHGVDGLQDVAHKALFYHPVWSRDAWEQAYGRLWRTGQKFPVDITTLICNDTLDDIVVSRVEDRGDYMKLFAAHFKK